MRLHFILLLAFSGAICGGCTKEKSEDKVSDLIRLLGHPNQAQRSKAFEALILLGEEDRQGLLAQLPASSVDPEVADALEKLHRMLYPSPREQALDAANGDERLQGLVEAFCAPQDNSAQEDSSESNERSEFLHSSHSHGYSKDYERVLLPLLKDPDPRLREDVVDFFGQFHHGKDLPDPAPLEPLLEDEDARVRLTAIWALGELEWRLAIPKIIRRLKDEDASVRCMAAKWLGLFRDPLAAPFLMSLLDDANDNVRQSAVEALGELGATEARPRILPLLHSSLHYLRAAAARALGKITYKPAIPDLRKGLEDPDGLVREGAVSSLGLLEDRAAIPLLRKAIHQPGYIRVPLAAGKVLARWKDMDSLPQIEQVFLNSASSSMRHDGIDIVVVFGNEASARAIAKRLEDPDRYVRMHAGEALGVLRHRPGIPFLARMLDDPDPSYRQRAAKAMAGILQAPWEGTEPGVEAARAWWAKHRGNPEFASKP